MNRPALIAIVGKPNVGKSTLFNRLIQRRYAIISDIAGTTRDQISYKYNLDGYKTILVDTGGLEDEEKENIESDVQSQAIEAINEADLSLFLLDLTEDLTADDQLVADILRKSEKPCILVLNKCDNNEVERNQYEAFNLGFDEPILISASHKINIEGLTEKIKTTLKKLGFKNNEELQNNEEESNSIKIALLGKPNAGKSSFINAITGKKKVIVSDIPGTTRDTTDTDFLYEEDQYTLIDTAGLRRRGKIEKGLEKYSALRTISGISRSDVVVLMIDAEKGLSSQDLHIAEHALENYKGLIIAINKEDLLTEGEKEYLLNRIRHKFSFVPWAAAIFISAKNRTHIFQILKLSKEIYLEREKRIKTTELNHFLQKITYKHQVASAKANKPKFKFIEQVDTNPPTFLLFFKNPESLHFSYPRYIENSLRKEYGFNGTAIELKFKKGEGKAKDESKKRRTQNKRKRNYKNSEDCNL